MAFKLGSKKNNRAPLSFKKETDEIPGTPIFRKNLGKGIMGEANNDGTIFLNKDVPKGSDLEAHVLLHEMQHMTDMKLGKLKYDDNSITWNGETYERKDGKVFFEGEFKPEGDKSFPWEKMPWEAKYKNKK
tara:strand:- start:72 stop:464 length:393 start_codon:yes stop_codon:yes gene_type:complete